MMRRCGGCAADGASPSRRAADRILAIIAAVAARREDRIAAA